MGKQSVDTDCIDTALFWSSREAESERAGEPAKKRDDDAEKSRREHRERLARRAKPPSRSARTQSSIQQPLRAVGRWDLQTGARVDDCVALNRPHAYHAMELRLSEKREVNKQGEVHCCAAKALFSTRGPNRGHTLGG